MSVHHPGDSASGATSTGNATVAPDAGSPAPAKGRGKAVGSLAVAGAVDNSENSLINTFFPLIRDAFGLSLGALGVMASISRFARMIAGPAWAMAADRFGRKKVLFIVTGLWGLWTASAGLAQSYTMLLILYGIGVVGTVASEPIINGLLGDLFDDKQRGRAFGTVRGLGALIGMGLGPAIALFAKDPDGWRYGMFAMGGLSVLSGFLILLFVKEPERRTAISDDPDVGRFRISDAVKLFKIPTIALLAGMLPLVTSLVLFTFFVTFMVDERGWEVPSAALLFSVFTGGMAISSLLGGFLGDWFFKRFGPKGRVMLMQIYLVATAAMSVVAMQIDWGKGVAVYVVMFLFGLIALIGFSACVLPMVSTVAPKQLSSTAFAVLFSLIQGGLSALMTLAMGFLGEALGLTKVMLYLVTVPYLLNAVYWFVFYKTYPKDFAKQEERTAAVEAGTF
ncbi:MFS transporter [Streptomyces sp. LHD-70]|uniref:MFS transporter n=1 Tax=Streptomyces sp. LHD-70 TaxID=3072140 RepID=UPI00280CFBA0|nr:MFS transporter [Streptomyces sp. LHD-70]MDQ8705404.1 MFS transporter [Streptomyces sp. LHD-70]